MVDNALGAKWYIMLWGRNGKSCPGGEMIDNALGAMGDNAVLAKWSRGEMVGSALGAKRYVILQASLTITHTANVPLNPGRHLSSNQVGVIGSGALEDHSSITV